VLIGLYGCITVPPRSRNAVTTIIGFTEKLRGELTAQLDEGPTARCRERIVYIAYQMQSAKACS